MTKLFSLETIKTAHSPALSLHLTICYSDDFIRSVSIEKTDQHHLSWLFHTSEKNSKLEKRVEEWIANYQAKCPTTPNDLPLYYCCSSSFTNQVVQTLVELPFGQVMTYKEVAEATSSPKAARAVGTICRRNSFPFFIPCHRVLGHGQKLGGYSAGGKDVKQVLLNFEGVYLT